MNSGCGNSSGYLPPIKPPPEPLLMVVEVVAIDRVVLNADGSTIEELERFYVDLFGFKVIARSRGDGLLLRWDRRDILIAPGHPNGPNVLMIRIHQFGRTLQILDELKIDYDVITQEVGRSRVAMLYDPAGNLIELLEHRPL